MVTAATERLRRSKARVAGTSRRGKAAKIAKECLRGIGVVGYGTPSAGGRAVVPARSTPETSIFLSIFREFAAGVKVVSATRGI